MRNTFILGLVFLLFSATITALAKDDFDPNKDAKTLHDAVHIFTADTKKIIEILSSRTHEQRVEINSEYKKMFKKGFADEVLFLNFELYGNFKKLLALLMRPTAEIHAEFLKSSQVYDTICDSKGSCYDTYNFLDLGTAIMSTVTNEEMLDIKDAYKTMYGNSLKKDLEYYSSMEHEDFLLALCEANRDETSAVDKNSASFEALNLYDAGEKRLGTDESVFISTFTKKNYAQLNQIFSEYRKITGHDIEIAIDNEFSGVIEVGLLSIVKWVKKGSAEFFADMFFNAMDGAGTEDNELIWLVAICSQKNMSDIKNVFWHKYGQTLGNMISGDTSGSYEDLILALIK